MFSAPVSLKTQISVCHFLDFIPQAIYVIYFLRNKKYVKVGDLFPIHCGYFSCKQQDDGCTGRQMLLIV